MNGKDIVRYLRWIAVNDQAVMCPQLAKEAADFIEAALGIMEPSVIVAIVTGIASVAAVVITNNKSNMERDNKADIERAVTIEKLDELTREVRRHNGFAERIPILEERTTTLTKRVTNLEQKKGA